MKRIMQADLQQLYAPLPEAAAARMEQLLSALPERKEPMLMKKKLPAMALMLALLLILTFSAAAAMIGWNAIQALYGREKPELEGLLVPVNQQAEAGGIRMEIASVLTDGRSLVLDWTLKAQEDSLPAFIVVEDMTSNGQLQFSASPALTMTWLREHETQRQGCEILPLSPALRPGETIHIEMTLRISRPSQKVQLLDSALDEARAAALREQGVWAVAPLHKVYAYRFDENNIMSATIPSWDHYTLDGLPEELFTHHRMTFSFDVTVPEASVQPLFPDETGLALDGCTLSILEAIRTPLGIYTTMEIITDMPTHRNDLPVLQRLNSYETSLQLRTGEPPVEFWGYIDEPVTQGEDGRLHRLLHSNMIGYQSGLTQDSLPLTLIIGEWVYCEPIGDDPGSAFLRELHRIPLLLEAPATAQ